MPLDVDAAVISNTRLSEDYSVVALAAPEIAALARPGQFVMVKPTRGTDPLLRRPFSIFEVLRDPRGAPSAITLLNKRVGAGTRLLYEVEPGARVACLGPLGRPFEPVDPPARAWMIAGGVGLAPFLTLMDALVSRGTEATLFYGARRASELYCADRFERAGVRVLLTTEDGSRGARGLVTDALKAQLDLAASAERVHLYACGPTAMMRAVAAIAAGYGRSCDVSLEQVMGCGLGGCYSCVVPIWRAISGAGRGGPASDDPGGVQGAPLSREARAHYVRSCTDGPVFDARTIVWEALAH